jgi:hypothetical protein
MNRILVDAFSPWKTLPPAWLPAVCLLPLGGWPLGQVLLAD